jgi:hypothetical protein
MAAPVRQEFEWGVIEWLASAEAGDFGRSTGDRPRPGHLRFARSASISSMI